MPRQAPPEVVSPGGTSSSPRWVAMLRGINVGGKRKLSMPDLAAAFRAAGCTDVATYIQSGNVVFTPPPSGPPPSGPPPSGPPPSGPPPSGPPGPAGGGGNVGERLEQAVEEVAGFPVPIILRTVDELAAVLGGSPFPDDDPTKLHVAFLGSEVAPADLDAFGRSAVAPEAFAPAGLQLYLHLPEGLGRAKLPLALGRLKTSVTVRNWRTVTKLYELGQG